jgi:hypothetical protein
MTMRSIFFHNAVKAVAVSAVVLITAGCGVKSAPATPDGGYPHQYPASEAKTEIGTPAATSEGTRDETGAVRSPLGFPLEYPNRAIYK